uniref:MIT domain-containing protein n=1 Tax=Gongylonema pulchrum TaxID=637853 RepID=A0A183D5Q9_9BILA
LGNWQKAAREARDLAKHFGSQDVDSEEMKLKAYEQYLHVKHMLQNAYNEALRAEPGGDEKKELGEAKEKLHKSYDEASSALDAAATAAKIIIKKLLKSGSEYGSLHVSLIKIERIIRDAMERESGVI